MKAAVSAPRGMTRSAPESEQESDEASLEGEDSLFDAKAISVRRIVPFGDFHFASLSLADAASLSSCRSQFCGSLLLLLVTRGSLRIEMNTHHFQLDEGDMVFVDLGEMKSFSHAACDVLCLVVDPYSLGWNIKHFLSRSIAAGTLVYRMLQIHLNNAAQSLVTASPAELLLSAQTTGLVLNQCFKRFGKDAAGHHEWIASMQKQICDYIELHLHDTELDQTAIGYRFRLSRSYLYKMFPYSGGINRYISNRRLDMVFKSITEGDRSSIGRLAENFGFRNDRQLNRTFLSRFEISINDLRNRPQKPRLPLGGVHSSRLQ
ncbi:MAG: helix-turn-helix transcriptional regulator [Xanthomonadaceae bacterium]|nr:helix-turn-helix transcriptional regulator [Xanthomonadaceae bacterium]